MFSSVQSAAIFGMKVHSVQVEADLSNGLPSFTMVGFASTQVKEAQDRVRTALKNLGIALPPKKMIVNLAPADLRKEGAGFDLPVAVAILAAMGQIPEGALKGLLITGEVGLDGTVNPVAGVLPMVIHGREEGFVRCMVPWDNLEEGRMIQGIQAVGVRNLQDVLAYFRAPENYLTGMPPQREEEALWEYPLDFRDIHGQQAAKRAAEIAVSGFHNLLLVGPPGAGKSMTAKRIPTIFPPLTPKERLEVTKVYSIAGLLSKERTLLGRRPFRAPHHTISPQALAGGGTNPKPGEITLAHRGVLFLDELPEFARKSLEILRQPLEDKEITLARVSGTYTFPANVLLVAAMNPCPCGYYPDMNRCTCLPREVTRYMNKISHPLLERIDLCVEVSEVSYRELTGKEEEESSAKIRKRVERVHEIQRERYRELGIQFNGELSSGNIEKYCQVTPQGKALLERVYEMLHLSARSYHRMLKLSRTIADMEGEERVDRHHIREALGYRLSEPE